MAADNRAQVADTARIFAGRCLPASVEYPHHWRVSFYATGMAHSVVYGSGWEATPWRAASRAAWQAITDARMAV